MSKSLECTLCGTEVHKCDTKAVAAICWICVSENFQGEPAKKRREGFPRGWRFMKVFVHSNGSVYYKGIEQPELKGTLAPTTVIQKQVIKKSKVQRAQEKQDALAKINKLKKSLKAEGRKTYQKKLQTEINKLQKSI